MANWPSDKELEEIYRKGSEMHDFDYNPKAWDQMALLLNKRRKNKILLLLFLGLLFVSVTTITYMSFENSSDKLVSNKSELSLDSKADETKGSLIDTSMHEGFDNISSNPTTAQYTISQPSKFIDVVDNRIKQSQMDDSSGTLSTISSQSNITTTIQNNQSIVNSNSNYKSESRNEILTEDHAFKSVADAEIIDVRLIYKLPIGFIKTIKSVNVNIPENAQSSYFQENTNYPKFAINTIIGTESSWTPNGEFSRIDYSVGMGISYFPHKKLAVSFSANYMNDVYKAMQGDYSPPKGYWKNLGAPEYTSASCNMIETSYGISYFLKGNQQKGIVANINLLSNFMLSERYYYHYSEDVNNFMSSWNMENVTWLSSLSLATDYNFKLSEKWFLRAGPYIKIPVEGIGHGNVMLSSFGFHIQASFISK